MLKLERLFLLLLGPLVLSALTNAVADELPNRAEPLPGITTSGQPDQQSLRDLAEAGYVAVIDLRAANEDRGYDEQAEVERLGMNYIALPIPGAQSISFENASALDEILGGVDGPVLLHCASGNRVGALLSLRARLHGASNEEALKLGDEAGLSSLRPTVETVLETR